MSTIGSVRMQCRVEPKTHLCSLYPTYTRGQQAQACGLSVLRRPAAAAFTRKRVPCLRSTRLQWGRTLAASTDTEITVEEDTMEKMERSLESVTRNFASIRTGRAVPSMLDRVKVDYYGAATPLKSLAGVSAPESTLLVVQPYDMSAMQLIEKAIMASDLNLTPSNDGKLIRINIPSLTADRRKEMVKTVSKLGEDGKVSIRNVRRESMKQLDKHEKDGDVSEDEKKAYEDSIQELTDDYVKQIDKLVKGKQDELSKV